MGKEFTTSLEYVCEHGQDPASVESHAYRLLLDSDIIRAMRNLSRYTWPAKGELAANSWSFLSDAIKFYDAQGHTEMDYAPKVPAMRNAYRAAINTVSRWPEMDWLALARSHTKFKEAVALAERSVDAHCVEAVFHQLRAAEYKDYHVRTRMAQAHNILCEEIGHRKQERFSGTLSDVLTQALPYLRHSATPREVGSFVEGCVNEAQLRLTNSRLRETYADRVNLAVARKLLLDVYADVPIHLHEDYADLRKTISLSKKAVMLEEDFRVANFHGSIFMLRLVAQRLPALMEQGAVLPTPLRQGCRIMSSLCRQL